MTEILEGLDGPERRRIAALRRDRRYFWIDVSVRATSAEELGEALGIPEDAFPALLGFGDEIPSARKLFATEQLVVFAFLRYLESGQHEDRAAYRLYPLEVHVLVSRDCVLTLHEDRFSLPAVLAPYAPEGRSEQYVVYAIVEAMVASAFDALNEIEVTLDELAAISTNLRAGRLRMATLRSISSRLARMRRRVAPHRGLFERIGVALRGDDFGDPEDERYFDRLGEQVNRLVDAIDAAADALATAIDLRLNETTYRLTMVATIFLPLTFLTGFFGMNFGWMVDQIDTPLAFWLLGIGSLAVGVALILRLIVRGSPVQTDEDIPEREHQSR